jgi:thiol-disulfide isomerase/thioredoxin
MHSLRLLLFVGVLSILSVGCSGARSGEVVPGGLIPDFQVTSDSGESVSIRSLTAGKPTIVHLWASWCDVCQGELPSLVRLRQRLATGPIQIINIGIQDTSEALRTAAEASGWQGPLYLDSSGQGGRRLQTTGVPETFFLDAQGRFIMVEDERGRMGVRIAGPKDWDAPSSLSLLRSSFHLSVP